jgi:hypothetical protein
MKQYYPKRDRGVYRAAANVKSPLHSWAKGLVNSLKKGGTAGALRWVYRDMDDFSIKSVVYSINPLIKL